jgi:hypothetical protein
VVTIRLVPAYPERAAKAGKRLARLRPYRLTILVSRSAMQDFDADGRQLQRFSDPIGWHTFPDQQLHVPIEVRHQMLDE